MGGVSGTYLGKNRGKLAGWCQQNEFARWGFDNQQRRGKTVILSGAASVFRAGALRKVLEGRVSGNLPPGDGGVYNIDNITEDFELSLALMHTGSRIKNMHDTTIYTAVKPTWRTLGVQRLRWDRGINEGLFQYGFTRHTATVWRRRISYAIYVPVSLLCIGMLLFRLGNGSGYTVNPFWLTIAGIMAAQKAVTIVRNRGVFNALAAFLLVFELPYDTFLQVVFVRSLWDGMTRRAKRWR
jgi:cellulose synthase/poly-beta-1,6-N-acetylglucosamine synthase-like glycosyltransferase